MESTRLRAKVKELEEKLKTYLNWINSWEFQTSRVNKREYPGNANVIGPTTVPSFSESLYIVEARQNVTGSCIGPEPILGCCAYIVIVLAVMFVVVV